MKYFTVHDSKLAIVVISSLLTVGCSGEGPKQEVGTIVGGAGGAILGSTIGKGEGRLAATAIGAILSAAVGAEVGRSLDDADKVKATAAFHKATKAPVGSAVNWKNPHTGNYGTVATTRDGMSQTGQYCREFQQSVTIANKLQQVYGVACRQKDGQWRIME